MSGRMGTVLTELVVTVEDAENRPYKEIGQRRLGFYRW